MCSNSTYSGGKTVYFEHFGVHAKIHWFLFQYSRYQRSLTHSLWVATLSKYIKYCQSLLLKTRGEQ